MCVIRKYAHLYAATDEKAREKMKEYEAQGRFNDHLDDAFPPYKPIDEKYRYFTKNPFKKALHAAEYLFIVLPFMRYSNRLFRTEVVGRENLRQIEGGAVVVCNHVNKLDCMAVKRALLPKKSYFAAAEFNNMTGFFGDMMRVGGMLPIPSALQARRRFDAAVATALKRGRCVAFFPERAEWPGYEKPRPQMSGAYHYAVKNDVPVLPMFITFRPEDASPTDQKQFVLHILPPIYADKTLHDRENFAQMKARCETLWRETYETFYGKKL